VLEVYYRIGNRIARCGKNHTIAENLISPNVENAVLCMPGEEQVRKININPLSNTISRRFQDMAEDIEAMQ
jgi:hypothetical protein